MRRPSRSRSLQNLGEFGLIREIRNRFGKVGRSIIKGIGDDAAVIRPTPGSTLLVSTDLFIEGIHFHLGFQSLFDVGYRATASNLSDIAAMGGCPQYLLVALAIPDHLSLSGIRKLYRGLMHPCQFHGVELIGGDTSSSQSGIFVSLTILGRGESGHELKRGGAQVGDLVYVTGTLGDSRAGLHILQSRYQQSRGQRKKPYEQFLIKRHLRPIPRIHLGRLLAKQRLAKAAIDLSDGLSGDLRHLCEESKVGVELWAKAIPLSSQFRAYAAQERLDSLQLALMGGEDYELLFTISPRNQNTLRHASKALDLPITCIGEIKAKGFGIRLKLEDGLYRQIPIQSYDHFRQQQAL